MSTFTNVTTTYYFNNVVWMNKYLLDKQLPNITSQKFIAIPKIIQEDKWIINTDVKHFFFEDVALIKFDIPMQFNDQINKICIPITSKFKIHKDGPKTKSWYGKILLLFQEYLKICLAP